MTLDFSFDDQQQQLGQSARDVFSRRCPSTVVREIEASELGYSPELWREMADLGWLGICIPEAHGGGGAGFLDLYPIFDALGRSLVPGPHLDTIGVAAELIADVGSARQREHLLPAIAAGECIISLAIMENGGGFGPANIQLTARAADDGFVLSGTKLLVGWASVADRLLVVARTAPGDAEGISTFLVDPSTPGVSLERLTNIAGHALFAVTFDDVTIPRDDLLGVEGGVWASLSDVMTRAAVLQTASIVGAANVVLDMTARYAREREQFGVPIGSFQAVQYMVSDVLIDLHRTDVLARQAAFRIHTGAPSARASAMAVAFGKQASAHLHRQAHEVHAGVAFINEHDLTLYSRRAKYWENNLGDARYYRDMLARLLIDG